MELEHSIGFTGEVNSSVHIHRNGTDLVMVSGGCILISDVNDPHNQSFLRGHDDLITCLALSPSGNLIASGQQGEHADVIIWDFTTKELVYRLAEHDHAINHVAFSHDSRLLLSIGDLQDHKMFFWDMSTGYIVTSVPAHPNPLHAVAWGGFVKDIKKRDTSNYLLATCGSKSVLLWSLNPRTGEITHEKVNMGTFYREFTCLAFSPDGEWLYAGTSSGDVAVFNVPHRVFSTSYLVASQGVRSIQCISATHMVVGGGDGKLTSLTGEGGKEWYVGRQCQLKGPINSISRIVSPGNKSPLSADKKHQLQEMWVGTALCALYRVRVADFVHVLMMESHADAVTAVAYPPSDSDHFVTVSSDGTLRYWDAGTYETLCQGAVKNAACHCVCIMREISISGWSDGAIRCHDLMSGEEVWKIQNAHKDGVTAIQVANNGKFVVTGGEDGAVRVWELRTRELLTHLKEHTMRITDLALFKDDAHVLSCSRDRSILCWDLKKEKRIASHHSRQGAVHALALLDDQTRFISVGQDFKITYWDLREALPRQAIEKAHHAEVNCVDITRDGRYMVTGGSDQEVRLWDLNSGELLGEGKGHSGDITNVKFSPDAKQFVSVGTDGGIFVWNVYT